jgi:hypothetical protein
MKPDLTDEETAALVTELDHIMKTTAIRSRREFGRCEKSGRR